MRKRKFNIELWKERESDLFVINCDKPEIASQGKTLSEAFMMIGDAIELMEEKDIDADNHKLNKSGDKSK